MSQFHESMNECLVNSEGFSESAYNYIHSSITSTQNIQDIQDVLQPDDTLLFDSLQEQKVGKMMKAKKREN